MRIEDGRMRHSSRVVLYCIAVRGGHGGATVEQNRRRFTGVIMGVLKRFFGEE